MTRDHIALWSAPVVASFAVGAIWWTVTARSITLAPGAAGGARSRPTGRTAGAGPQIGEDALEGANPICEAGRDGRLPMEDSRLGGAGRLRGQALPTPSGHAGAELPIEGVDGLLHVGTDAIGKRAERVAVDFMRAGKNEGRDKAALLHLAGAVDVEHDHADRADHARFRHDDFGRRAGEPVSARACGVVDHRHDPLLGRQGPDLRNHTGDPASLPASAVDIENHRVDRRIGRGLAQLGRDAFVGHKPGIGANPCPPVYERSHNGNHGHAPSDAGANGGPRLAGESAGLGRHRDLGRLDTDPAGQHVGDDGRLVGVDHQRPV